MCELFDPYTSRLACLVCAPAIKRKIHIENIKRGYEVQIEGYYPGEKLQRTRGTDQGSDQIHGQARVEESPNKTQEE